MSKISIFFERNTLILNYFSSLRVLESFISNHLDQKSQEVTANHVNDIQVTLAYLFYRFHIITPVVMKHINIYILRKFTNS